jgi:hypothetical protein
MVDGEEVRFLLKLEGRISDRQFDNRRGTERMRVAVLEG